MGYDPNYRRGWAQDFEDLHADALTGDTRRVVRSLPASLRSARHDLAIMPPEDAVDALIGLQDLAAMLATDLAATNKRATEAEAALKQAQSDARLFAGRSGLFPPEGLSEEESAALDTAMLEADNVSDKKAAVALRRILAAGGAR